MFSKESPIGIIDSGIGGFSVARKVQKLLPRRIWSIWGTGPTRPMATTPRRRSSL